MKAWILALALLGCSPAVTPAYVAPCAAACEHGRDLACDWSATTPAGASCEAVCEAVEATGYDTIHPACMASAKDCEEAERVSREGCP